MSPSQPMPLAGTRALVVGGAGVLGESCSRALTGAGADVAVLDLQDCVDVDAAVGEIAGRTGGIDLLVNCGSPAPAPARFADQDEAALTGAVRRHLGAMVDTTRAVLDVMIPQQAGRIVNVASDTSGTPGRVVRDACAAAVVALTQNLAEELPDHGISAVAVRVSPAGDHPGSARAEDVARTVAFLASPAAAGAHGTVVTVGRP